MSLKIEDIIKEIKGEFDLSTYDIERMVDSQFRFIESTIRDRSLKTVNLIYIGKFRPTGWFKKNYDKVKLTKEEREIIRQAKRDKRRLEESNPGQGETPTGT